MYYKTGDFAHFRTRTGSHATKGTGRGTVWWKSSWREANPVPKAPMSRGDHRLCEADIFLQHKKKKLRKSIASLAKAGNGSRQKECERELAQLCGVERGVKAELLR